jgi:hypothetical protein
MVHLDRRLVDILPVAVAVGLLIDRVLIWYLGQVAQVVAEGALGDQAHLKVGQEQTEQQILAAEVAVAHIPHITQYMQVEQVVLVL